MIYLDASALLKLVVAEDESEALAAWLGGTAGVPKVTSALSAVEVLRACRRLDEAALPVARRLLDGIDRVPLAADVLERAATLAPPELRTLDALHLASALVVGPALDAFVCYDHRLAAAAQRTGFVLVAPR